MGITLLLFGLVTAVVCLSALCISLSDSMSRMEKRVKGREEQFIQLRRLFILFAMGEMTKEQVEEYFPSMSFPPDAIALLAEGTLVCSDLDEEGIAREVAAIVPGTSLVLFDLVSPEG